MYKSPSVCLSCRLRLLSRLYPYSPRLERSYSVRGVAQSKEHLSHRRKAIELQRSFALQRRQVSEDASARTHSEEADGQPEFVETEPDEGQDGHQDLSQEAQETARELARSRLDPEAVARHARKMFGDRLPQDVLRDEEYRIYERLFGKPLDWIDETQDEQSKAQDEQGSVAVFQESEDGNLEELDMTAEDVAQGSGVEKPEKEMTFREAAEAKDIQTALAGVGSQESEVYEDEEYEMEEDEAEEEEDTISSQERRTHPFTLASRSGTDPSTLQLPREMTDISSAILADTSIKHLTEVSQRVFGGISLPYGIGTPPASRKMPQKPIPLTASQGLMAPIEAGAFLAALMPGLYASATSILVEVRRRLGTSWIEGLMAREGGPRILDAGAGGAGVMAWREILKAEWNRNSATQDSSKPRPAPLGKATVLTGSSTLRQRSSLLLENTTFLPRLPDYVHVRDDPDVQRKQFDIVIAPHTLWPLAEDYQRRQQILNLWRFLNPNGGVLILLEKGVPRGFEAIGEARRYLLKDLFASSAGEPASVDAEDTSSPSTSNATGAIIAPCTTHSSCPLYRIRGTSRQRKDYCHFRQRYIRPAYLQRILGAKGRNHDDVEFSYVAVQRGVTPEQLRMTAGDYPSEARFASLEGNAATDLAFAGYDFPESVPETPSLSSSISKPSAEAEILTSSSASNTDTEATITTATITPPNPLTLPRLIQTPLKRKGHVLIDLCTPSGTFERWTVPRSYGFQAYRDARKTQWGDLWPLGAKTRVPRHVRTGRGGRVDKESDVEGDALKANELDSGKKGKKERENLGQVARLQARKMRRVRRRREKADAADPRKSIKRKVVEEGDEDDD